MSADIHETTALRLRRDGQFYTKNRRTLVEVLVEADRPRTVPEIMAARKGLALSSIYRNIVVLERANVVHRIVTTGEFASYELAEDLTRHHHHLICTGCGQVEDFTASPQLESSMARAFTKIAAQAGFAQKSHRVDLLGLCRNCA
ncbi:MAG: Fur family transcriptional regulator [Actinomycetota bacterium]